MNPLQELSYVQPLGQIAVFYVPSEKLVQHKFGRDGKNPRQLIEQFFLSNFGGLTYEQSNIQGKWRAEGTQKTLVDRHDRYEVSFEGQSKTVAFLEFIAELCGMLQEESIYLTIGNRSWLVTPRAPGGQNLGALETRPG